MPETSLARINEFNQDLVALAATGLPIDLGEREGKTVASQLEQIRLALQTRIQHGQPIEQAIAEASELPATYRAALGTWLQCDDPTIALDAITAPSITKRRFGRHLGQTLVYPFIVLSLCYFGFLYTCSVLAPKIEAIYLQLGMTPSESLSVLTTSRDLMPIWGPLLPLLLVLIFGWWRIRGSRRDWTWIPGGKKYSATVRHADFARQMSRLMSRGMPRDESLLLALPLLGQDCLEVSGASTSESSSGNELPPLLRWALHGDLGGEPRERVLKMVASTYRKAAERQATIWQVAVPAVAGVLLAGMFVFGYGLCLLVPVVTLLEDLSFPGGG